MRKKLFGLPILGAALVVSVSALAGDWQTSFGDPDLQGTWTNATITTLERGSQFESLVLSEEQAKDYEQNNRFARSREADSRPTDPDEGAPAAGRGVGGYNTFWMDPGEKLVDIDGKYHTSIISSPEDGKIPYSKVGRDGYAAGMKRRADFSGPETRPLGERCMVGFGSTGGPPMLPVLYNNHYQIVQTPDHVLILVEMNHDARIVTLVDSARAAEQWLDAKPADQWLGHSAGYWEGDSLVVLTRGFHRDQNMRSATRHRFYIPPSARVTERFTRVADNKMHYEFTVEDEEAYTQPWQGIMPFYTTEEAIFEYACHEGNYALPGILAGARKDEE